MLRNHLTFLNNEKKIMLSLVRRNSTLHTILVLDRRKERRSRVE